MSRLGEAERYVIAALAVLRQVERETRDGDVMHLIVELEKTRGGIAITNERLRDGEEKKSGR